MSRRENGVKVRLTSEFTISSSAILDFEGSQPATVHRVADVSQGYAAWITATLSVLVELNRAVAVAIAFGPARGLELVDALVAEPSLLARANAVDPAR